MASCSFPDAHRQMIRHHVVKPSLPPLTCGTCCLTGGSGVGLLRLCSPSCLTLSLLGPVTNHVMDSNLSGLCSCWSKSPTFFFLLAILAPVCLGSRLESVRLCTHPCWNIYRIPSTLQVIGGRGDMFPTLGSSYLLQ